MNRPTALVLARALVRSEELKVLFGVLRPRMPLIEDHFQDKAPTDQDTKARIELGRFLFDLAFSLQASGDDEEIDLGELAGRVGALESRVAALER